MKPKTYSLEQYPIAIYEQQMKLHEIETEIQSNQQQIKYFDSDIELAIANDSDLRNETMRKAKRQQMRQNQDYLDIQAAIDELSDRYSREKFYLEFLCNCFSVAKINKREAIAQIMAGEIAA